MKILRQLILLAIVFNYSCLSISQQPDIVGVWMPEKTQWHHAPRVVDPHLSDAEVGLLQFKNDGSFLLLYCTIYRRLESLQVSAGDAETVYVGSWKLSGDNIEVNYRLKYRDIQWSRPGTDAYAEQKGVAMLLRGNLVLWNGQRFRKEPRLQAGFELQTSGFLKSNQ